MATVCAFALLVRFYGLGEQSLWLDEIASVSFARLPLRQLWSDWMVIETNPPLYYTLLKFWMAIFGESDFAVRSLSAVAGACAVPLTYLLGRELHSKRVGVIAAVLTAVWPLQVYYSQEARGYIFGVVAAMTAVLGLLWIGDAVRKAERSRRRPLPWIMYFGGCVVAAYIHTTLILLPLLATLYFAWLWAFASPRRKSPLAVWVLVNAAILVAWSWWAWLTWRQLHTPSINFGWIQTPTPGRAAAILFTVYGPSPGGVVQPLIHRAQVFAGLLFTFGAIWGAARLPRERAIWLGVFGVGLPLLLYLISLRTPIMLPRTLLWAQFAPILGLATALAAFKPRKLAIVAIALSIPIGVGVAALGVQPKQPWRELVSALSRTLGPSDIVMTGNLASSLAIQHYCAELRCSFATIRVAGPADPILRWAGYFYHGLLISPDDVNKLPAIRDRIWLVSFLGDYPRNYLARVAERTTDASPISPHPEVGVTTWRGDL